MSTSFADLGMSSVVVDALRARDITTPFAVQSLVVPDVLGGHDVLVKSPTGSGKTLAFGVPIVERLQATDARPSALILVPTRELAGQIVDEIRDVAHARALSVAAVYGGAGIQRQAGIARRAHILVATPGRLEDLIQRGAITLKHVRVLVLDEADRMLDMGFRPPVDRIVALTPKDRQTLFFSATLDGEVGRLAGAYTRDARRHEHAHATDVVADIEHRFMRVEHSAKIDHLVRELRANGRSRTLVFVRTKRGADRLVKRLRARDVVADAMHGDKSQGQRERALARFASGDVPTLVATDVAARGIDVRDIGHVINFDAPDDREGYVHRIGRTGRAGARGVGLTFVLSEQAADVGRIARDLGLDREYTRAGLVMPAARPAGRRPAQHQRGGSSSGGNRRRRPTHR